MSATTKGPTAPTAEPFNTDRANGPHHIPHTSKEYKDMTQSSDHPFTEGQKVRILAGRHAGKLGTVTEIDAGNVWVQPDGPRVLTAAPYTPEELEPVHTDDTVPATDAEVTEYLTGSKPTSNLDSWACPVCGWETHAAGPVDIDEPDAWQDGIDEHRRSHAPKTLGEVSAIRQWWAIKDTAPSLFDGLFAVVNTPAVDVAAALRALAEVLEEESR